ncbi:MAG: PqqD family peptide modification chaperone [Methanobacterium sp. ERen5]|nr:MAG: PqqD family peptide modification chaperone [Methanobacterium sp. ERen5]
MDKKLDQTLLVISDDVVSCDLDGETAILNIESGIYFGLDPIGTKIWNSLKKPSKISNLVEMIMSDYDVDKKRCENDLIELINNLKESGLVKVNESN